jgi:hypothetical protein
MIDLILLMRGSSRAVGCQEPTNINNVHMKRNNKKRPTFLVRTLAKKRERNTGTSETQASSSSASVAVSSDADSLINAPEY